MNFLRDTPVLVLGLGESGLAMARWCASFGADVRVWDSREQPPHADALRAQWPAVPILHGPLPDLSQAGVRLVLKSPGLAPHDERIAPLLAQARARGVAVMAELDLFAHALADLRAGHGWAPRVIAITGTNGKTTTTAMTALLIERSGLRVAAAGNIMPTLLERLGTMLDTPRDEWPEVWVLELSSFQLADAGRFEVDAATVLNVSQDHLDWHGSLAAYADAKARIFGRRTAMIVNRDDPRVESMVPEPTLVKPLRGRAPPPPQQPVIRFGLGPPQHAGDWGLVVEQGMAWLVRARPAEGGGRRAGDDDGELHIQRLMPADALRVRGRHNAANALAALALADAIGCPLAPMLHGLREYAGEPHRVQWIGSVGGVDAFDDSKGTNVGATVAAIDGLGADRGPGRLAVILGGDGKGQDFAPLAAPVARHARAVALIGRDAGTIAGALGATGVELQRFDDLGAAVAWCFARCREGDAVLLSPACASLDMFRNYGHRAEVFVDAVRELAADRGETL